MKPEEMYVEHDEYQAYDLEEFRKHIYQMVDSEPKRATRFERKKKSWKTQIINNAHTRRFSIFVNGARGFSASSLWG